MIVIQYIVAVSIILMSLFVYIHPNGYKDMTSSFSTPYFIGAIIYYIWLKSEVKK